MAIVMLSSVAPVVAQEPTITPNYKDADIRQIVEAVGAVTGKNFIIDPRVNTKVTMLSTTPMSPDAFYEAFLAILEVHNYITITSGDVIKVLPNASARQYPGPLSTNGVAADEIVTQVLQVENVSAAQLVPILRPLVPQYGHLVAHQGSNMLIISDRASNVRRLITIIRRIDQSTDEDVEIVSLQHASAAEIVRMLTALTQAPRPDGAAVSTSLVADSRTNSVLIGGDKSERVRLRTLIAILDTPLEAGGDTQVRYLRYADAESMATNLQQHFSQQGAAAGAGAAAAGGPGNEVSVWSDAQNNALVVNAPPKKMRELMQIVDKLDIRRAQVLVEAMIVEVIADNSSSLGVTWAIADESGNTPVGVTEFDSVNPSISQLAGAIAGDGVPTNLGLSSGLTFGIGRVEDGGLSFAAIINALEGVADTNIISTPTLVTTDNEEASINVGQEVPFVTGSFSNTGGNNGSVNPFQTIQREQVGVKLVITPQINEGDSLLLKVSQEISSIAQSSQGAADLITNERTVDTTVIVEDGGILVLGGLIEDTVRDIDQRVPILGRIPLLGALFRSRTHSNVKTNLMIFIRPRILRDSVQTAFETNQKYNFIRDFQRKSRGGGEISLPFDDSADLTSPESSQRPPLDLRKLKADENSDEG